MMLLTKTKISILFAASITGLGCLSMGANTPRIASATPTQTEMNQTEHPPDTFYKNLPGGFEQPKDDAGRLLLREYGAVFLARNGAVPPKKVVFKNEADVAAFQATIKSTTETIGGYAVQLQAVAMAALKEAQAEGKLAGVSISPRGADSARRGYTQTVSLWASRVNPGFDHWVAKGRVTREEAARIKALTPYEQVPEILRLENDNIFFAKDLSKSIIYSVAPPGTSQHLSMLALDVKEFENAKVREILSRHGWFQTVVSDLPHFTFIGVAASELPGLGLKKVINADRVFWIPDI